MNEYYFLFGMALIYTIFASIQDLKKREVANWLNFSLLSFALAYRAIYSLWFNNLEFLIFGILGSIAFFILSNLMYYGGVFAGGDAKLLLAFGAIMPYGSYSDLVFVSLGFLISLFVFGAIYSLIYSSYLAYKNKKVFKKDFSELVLKKRGIIYLSIFFEFMIFVIIFAFNYIDWFVLFGMFLIFLMPFLYIYLKAVELSSMIVLTKARDLTEGDWLSKDVKIGNKTIRRSVHGLSRKEIEIIKKYNKSVWVKQGIPFVPAFLFALIFMVFFYLVLRLDFAELFFSLF